MTDTVTTPPNPAGGERKKQRKGFAAMAKSKQREIASKGGKAAHQKGTAYEWDRKAAAAAGKKGGAISRGGRGRLPPGADRTPESDPSPA